MCIRDRTTTDPFGEWILTGIFLSDAKDTPCGWQVNDHKEINLKMEKDTKGAIMISGQSVVNSYGGKVESIVYNDADKKGKIKITNLNTTERAGPKELMLSLIHISCWIILPEPISNLHCVHHS